MKVKQGFVLCETDGKYVAVATGKLASQFHGLITMNKSGKFLWEQLSEHISAQELTDRLLKVCKADPALVQNSVQAFLQKMYSAGILELDRGESL